MFLSVGSDDAGCICNPVSTVHLGLWLWVGPLTSLGLKSLHRKAGTE